MNLCLLEYASYSDCNVAIMLKGKYYRPVVTSFIFYANECWSSIRRPVTKNERKYLGDACVIIQVANGI